MNDARRASALCGVAVAINAAARPRSGDLDSGTN